MTNAPQITVVVCTRDRTDALAVCLRALLSQTLGAAEIIVVDSAPADQRTAALCAGLPVHYIREVRPGLSIARNRGIREARSPIIAFTDDDAIAEPEWLAAFAEAFRDPNVMIVTGRVEATELSTEAQRLFEHSGGMSKGTARRDFERRNLTSRQLIAVQSVGVGANMALRADVLQRVGFFDPRLGAGTAARGAEDLDFFHRALAADLMIRYEPAAIVRHRHRETMSSLRAQMFDTGCGFGVYLLTLLGRGTLPRSAVFRYALGHWTPWLMGRLAKAALGRHALPSSIVWAQIEGALHAPSAYRATRRERRIE